jgi:hypothetical protein
VWLAHRVSSSPSRVARTRAPTVSSA